MPQKRNPGLLNNTRSDASQAIALAMIVNVTSSVTLAPMPLAAAYTASKQAIEDFTGALAHELAAFGISVRLVEPGYDRPRAFRRTSTLPSRI